MCEESHKIQLYLYGRDYIDEQVLPSTCEGTLWVYRTLHEERIKLFEVVAIDNQWYIMSNDHCCVQNNQNLYNLIDQEMQMVLHTSDEDVFLISIPYEASLHKYTFYKPSVSHFYIGRNHQCEIHYAQEYISDKHAKLSIQDGEWYITDLNSANGTFVNGERVVEQQLHMKDTIQIVGLKLLVGPNLCLYVNQIKECHIHGELELAILPQSTLNTEVGDENLKRKRLPYLEFHPNCYSIDSPPSIQPRNHMPLLLVLGPAFTMGLSSISMGLFSLYQVYAQHGNLFQSMPTLIMSFSMAVGSLLWPLLSRRYEKKMEKDNIEKNKSAYLTYLNNIEQEINDEMDQYKSYCMQMFHDGLFYAKHLCNGALFEVHEEHPAFLIAVLGIGNISYKPKFDVNKEGFIQEEDCMREKRKSVFTSNYIIHNIPITISLKENKHIYVVGDDRIRFMMRLLYQFVITHRFQDIGILVFVERDELYASSLQLLPHLSNYEGNIRYLISDDRDMKHVLAHIDELSNDKNRNVLCFFFHENLAKRWQRMYPMQKSDFTCFYAVHDEDECEQGSLLRVQNEIGMYSYKETELSFRYNLMNVEIQKMCSYIIGNFTSSHKQQNMSQSIVRFLDIYACANCTQLNIWKRWESSDITTSLEVPIGILQNGELLCLDAHDHFHGPHGLFAGMTGSGKSECLLTYILSLALNFSPYDVTFLFIDYKGGTMSRILESLPHTVGIITNLDKATLHRSLESLQSELLRRQRIFSKVAQTHDIGNINIDKYCELCKQDSSLERLAHLFIIADEFAELKAAQSDFMEQLKQTARIGRSLGIHLFLATQKPAGVIDDQIWSNAHFHLCMKVQSTQDSCDMLKREDAAYLKKAGECYLQVGQDEIYERGIIAWSTCPYVEHAHYEKEVSDELSLLTPSKDLICNTHIRSKTNSSCTQLEAVLNEIIRIARIHDMAPKKLWYSPLVDRLYVENFKYAMMIVDDLKQQYQYPVFMGKSWLCHIMIYAMKSENRTAFCMTYIASLIRAYKEEEIRVYILDFDTHELNCFYHHDLIADILYEEDQEKVSRLFFMLKEELQRRKNVHDYVTIIVIIHNYEHFHERFEEYEEVLLFLLREGEKYNINFMLSVSSMQGISYRLTQYVHQNIVFQLHDRNDYVQLFPQCDLTSLLRIEHMALTMVNKIATAVKILLYSPDEINQLPKNLNKRYRICTMPMQVTHRIESNNCLYIGKAIHNLEDIYWQFNGKHILYITCANRFLSQYIYLLKKQSLQKDNVFLINEQYIMHKKRQIPHEELHALMKQEAYSVFIWEKPYLIDNNATQVTIKEIPMNHHTHIFLFTMQEQVDYMNYEWFMQGFYEADILWIGKGIDEFRFTLKSSVIPSGGLKSNEAYLLKEDVCLKLQVWEEVFHG